MNSKETNSVVTKFIVPELNREDRDVKRSIIYHSYKGDFNNLMRILQFLSDLYILYPSEFTIKLQSHIMQKGA